MRNLLFVAALAGLMAAPAMGQAKRPDRSAMQQDVTRAQAQQMADGMFQRFDVNHDGVVTRAEAEALMSQFGGGDRVQHMIDRTFATAQSLTLQQFEAQSLARFDRDDLNHDGTVTAAERIQARASAKTQNPGQ